MEGAKALSKVIEENKTLRQLYLWADDSLGEGLDPLLAIVCSKILLYSGFTFQCNTSIHQTPECCGCEVSE